MLVKVKIDVRGYKRIVLQDCKLGWSSLFYKTKFGNIVILVFWRICEKLYRRPLGRWMLFLQLLTYLKISNTKQWFDIYMIVLIVTLLFADTRR